MGSMVPSGAASAIADGSEASWRTRQGAGPWDTPGSSPSESTSLEIIVAVRPLESSPKPKCPPVAKGGEEAELPAVGKVKLAAVGAGLKRRPTVIPIPISSALIALSSWSAISGSVTIGTPW